MTLYDEARAYATLYPTPGTGEASWSGMCGSLMFRFGAYTTPGWNPVGDISSADSVSRCSGPLSPMASDAPVGAFHFYRDGGDGHVQVDLLGGGTQVFHASRTLDTVWGSAIGVINLWTYLAAKPSMKYVGWSMNYAGATLASFAAPVAVRPPVAVAVSDPAPEVVPNVVPVPEPEPKVATMSTPKKTPAEIVAAIDAISSNPEMIAVSKKLAAKIPAHVRKIIYSIGEWMGAAATIVSVIAAQLNGNAALYGVATAALLLSVSNAIAKANVS
jgi:hypothetical protein